MPAHADEEGRLLERLTKTMLDVGVLLQAAAELPGAAARRAIGEALSLLDDAVRAARDHVFAESNRDAQVNVARSPLNEPGRSRWSAARTKLLHERMLETARGLHGAAAENAALLEEQVALVREPLQADIRIEVKRWQIFASQAEDLARRLEHGPDR